MLALATALILIPLLYIPGALISIAALGSPSPSDRLARTYERAMVGALLNGWLAFTLAQLGWFHLWLHLLLIVIICLLASFAAYRRGALRLPQTPLGITFRASAGNPPAGQLAAGRSTRGLSPADGYLRFRGNYRAHGAAGQGRGTEPFDEGSVAQ